MGYRRFAIVPYRSPPATAATFATHPLDEVSSVADVAGVAAPLPADSATPFAAALASLLANNPTRDERRWLLACDDAAVFLLEWGRQAEALGWTKDDLFGLHPLSPLARYDAIGLIWLLKGRRVRSLTTGEAVLQDDLRFRRRELKVPHANCSIT
jgi:hypothetical protein